VRAQAQLHSQHIRRASRQRRHRDVRADHSIRDLIDSPIPAYGKHKIDVLLDRLARHRSGGARPRGLERSRMNSAPLQRLEQTAYLSRSAAAQLARDGVIDQNCILVGSDTASPTQF